MAITKLMNIKQGKMGGGKHLSNSIRYIMNPKKTEDGKWIGGNAGVTSDEVYQMMMDTKMDWDKLEGRQGYHFVISFKPGEATEEIAYQVLKEFCEEYLGDNYDYVFSIHNDHDHMHGHIVFNSVNRISGYKYRWNKPVLVDAFDIINHLQFNFSKPMNLLENNGAKLDGQSLYTLTNENAYKGAGMLAHSEVLEQIGSLLSDNNYYILPSSKHELLIVLDDGSKSVKELREMVQYVNEKVVSAKDLLSDKILHYNSKEKVLELAVDKAENLSKEITNTKQEDVAKNTAKQPKKTAEFTPRM